LLYNLYEFGKSCFYVAAEMHAQGAAFAVGQNLEVSASLCRFHYAESVFLSGDGQVVASSQVICRNTPLFGPPL
jgi:hypothetical protein